MSQFGNAPYVPPASTFNKPTIQEDKDWMYDSSIKGYSKPSEILAYDPAPAERGYLFPERPTKDTFRPTNDISMGDPLHLMPAVEIAHVAIPAGTYVYVYGYEISIRNIKRLHKTVADFLKREDYSLYMQWLASGNMRSAITNPDLF